jgi:uncharacterized membrane protein (DUF4010 family)
MTRDTMVLAAVLVAGALLLAWMPAGPTPWLAGLDPRKLLLLVVLILLLQAAGHIACRLAGPRAGMALAGFFSGFVSSTATVASMGARSRARPTEARACEAGAMLSTAATWLQMLAMAAAVAPAFAGLLLPVALAGAGMAAATGLRHGRRASAAGPVPEETGGHGPLRLREALLVAALLSGVSLGVTLAQQHFGAAGVLVGTALGALADAHTAVAALATLTALTTAEGAGQVPHGLALAGVLVAVVVNSVSRTVVAAVAGGAGYAARVGVSLLLSGAAAGITAAGIGLAIS